MTREELEHLIRAAADVTNEYEFVVVGSQSILGPIPNPPAELTMPMPVEEASKKTMRARIRRWVRILEERGYRLPG